MKKELKYRYLLFDLDGTLTDPREGITKSAQYALDSFGISEPDLDKLLCFIGPPLQDSFAEFYGMDPEQVAIAVARFRERYQECGVFENRAYEGIIDLLDQLCKAGKILAISTSKPTYFADMVLEKYGLRRFFKVVVGSELDGTRSKKAEVIEETLLRLGLSDEDRGSILMIGDRKHDILGAKECRIDSMGVRFGYAEENELEEAGADYIAATVKEAGERLLQM